MNIHDTFSSIINQELDRNKIITNNLYIHLITYLHKEIHQKLLLSLENIVTDKVKNKL